MLNTVSQVVPLPVRSTTWFSPSASDGFQGEWLVSTRGGSGLDSHPQKKIQLDPDESVHMTKASKRSGVVIGLDIYNRIKGLVKRTAIHFSFLLVASYY